MAESEKTDADQFDLEMEDLETALAVIHAEEEADAHAGSRAAKPRATYRGSLPQQLPRGEEVIKLESLICGCAGCLHRIGEDVSEWLDVVPAQFPSSSPVGPNVHAMPASPASRPHPRALGSIHSNARVN